MGIDGPVDRLLDKTGVDNLAQSKDMVCSFDMWLMHQSFVTTAPTYGEGWGIAGQKCGAITFRVSPQCRGNDRVLTLGFLHVLQGDFLLLIAGQRAKF